mgnify:CR=1 FL=1
MLPFVRTQSESKDATFNQSLKNNSTLMNTSMTASPATHSKVKRTKSMPLSKRPTEKQLKSRKVGHCCQYHCL